MTTVCISHEIIAGIYCEISSIHQENRFQTSDEDSYWWYISSAESVRLFNISRFVAYVQLNLLQLKWLTVNFAPERETDQWHARDENSQSQSVWYYYITHYCPILVKWISFSSFAANFHFSNISKIFSSRSKNVNFIENLLYGKWQEARNLRTTADYWTTMIVCQASRTLMTLGTLCWKAKWTLRIHFPTEIVSIHHFLVKMSLGLLQTQCRRFVWS